jgi:uncharacterized protein YqgC (DUF456 family)
MKNAKLWMWITIAAILIYIFLTDLFFEYIINREVRVEIQIGVGFVFLILTFIVLKLIVKNIINQIKFKKYEK